MTRIKDERICFFLKHQPLIEEWAGLTKQASEAIHEFLSTLVPGFEETAKQLGSEVQTYFRSKTDFPSILLFRENWKGGEETPKVAVGLEWPKDKVSFRGLNRPYIGVRVDRKQKGGAALVKDLKVRLDSEIKERGYTKGYSTSNWAAYRYVAPDYDEFWRDLEPFQRSLMKEIRSCWEFANAGIDGAISSESPGLSDSTDS